jgi:glycolate oxidase FAD binding subunit
VINPGLPTLTDRTPQFSTFVEPVAPGSTAEVAEVLGTFAGEGRAVVPVGGGRALQLGNPTSNGAIGLSLARLDRVIDYQPTDMTLSVEAGATLAAISSVLGANGQQLPIEAPDPETATMGGLLATALTGPRRYGGGSLRDVIIGISVAYPDGTIGRAGGLVVKNVSGFDMMRIHLGALGTLGVITSANFKVLPIPRSEFTAMLAIDELAEVERLAVLLRAPSVRPVALVAARVAQGWQLSARYEGRSSGLGAVAAALGDVLGSHDRVEGPDSARHWQSFIDCRSFGDPAEVRLQVRSLPTMAIMTAKDILAVADGRAVISRFEIEPGSGTLTLSWSSYEHDVSAELVDAIRALDSMSAVVVQAAPDEVKRLVDVWGEPPESIELMRRLKHEFDPGRILNPGRFAGMI